MAVQTCSDGFMKVLDAGKGRGGTDGAHLNGMVITRAPPSPGDFTVSRGWKQVGNMDPDTTLP